MTHHSVRRFILATSFIVLTAMFLLVLTLNALRESSTQSTPLPEGPYLVKDIMPNEAHSYPAPIIPVGERAYFFAYDDQGHNLWISDGTEMGTHQIKDLNENVGAVPNPPKPMAGPTPHHGYDYPEVVDENLFFVADDGDHGRELWVSSGSMTDTYMVKDITAGTSGGRPILLTEVNGQLLFNPTFSEYGPGIWKSDGTMTNTNLVKSLTGPHYTGMVEMDGKAYFNGGDGIHGQELWTSDGSEEGTKMVKDIRLDADSSNPYLFYATDTHIFFFANNPGSPRFWQSDGTLTGTIPVQNTLTETTFTARAPWGNGSTTDTAIFFTASDDTYDNVLWVSDGTITGTHFVKDATPQPYYVMQAVGSRVFFFDLNGELWVSDGTEIGTFIVKDINPTIETPFCGEYIHRNFPMANLNGFLFFVANDGEHGCELWISDGTESGTFMVHDINSGANSSYPEYLAATDTTLFFMADDGIHGSELWSLGNMAPVAKYDTAVTHMNHPITIPVTNNDLDVNLDEFTITAVDDPINGTSHH